MECSSLNLQYSHFFWSDLLSNFIALPSVASSPNCLDKVLLSLALFAQPNWERELNLWESNDFFLDFLFTCPFYHSWLPFLGDQTPSPSYYTVRTVQWEGHSRASCQGQRLQSAAWAACGLWSVGSQFRDPLLAMAIKYILISISATTDSWLNHSYFTLLFWLCADMNTS